ncbi:MAG: hypothetical protein ABI183_04225 [Polyangiaceae bacterium]
MSNLSPNTLALLRAAKNDAPSRASRTAIWGGVTSGLVTHTPLHITPRGAAGQGAASPGPGIGASMTPQAAAATAKGGVLIGASLTGMKGAFIGALFGSALSIGVATFMMRAKPTDIPHAPSSAQPTQVATAQPTQLGDSAKSNGSSAAPNSTSAATTQTASGSSTDPISAGALPISSTPSKSGSSLNSGASSISVDKSPNTQMGARSSVGAKSLTDENQSLHSKKTTTATPSLSDDEMLSRETSLVSEARRDLLVGDADAALKTVRTARALEVRQFEPEEMSLEAKSLRALGRDTEAAKIESQLRTMYPNQTLGR